MNDRELEKEAERLGWTVEYLKNHLAKQERIEKVFDRLGKGVILKKQLFNYTKNMTLSPTSIKIKNLFRLDYAKIY